jgi:hypothetical protein
MAFVFRDLEEWGAVPAGFHRCALRIRSLLAFRKPREGSIRSSCRSLGD